MDNNANAISSIAIANRKVGIGQPCFVIAEIGQAHDGSLGTAYAYIDAAARAGADAVKFQTHIAEAESSPRESFRVKFSHQDATRYDYWKRMEFTAEQWAGLADYAREKELIFLSSAFSEAAVHILNEIGIPAWKIASGEIATKPMLKLMADTGKPLLVSTGMASWVQVEETVGWLRGWGARYALFQCTTSYPCEPEKWGLNVLQDLRRRYHCPVGFSDHSGRIAAGLAAVALGADLLEVHIVFSRDCFGPDVPASLTVDEFSMLVDGVSDIRSAMNHPVDKDERSRELEDNLKLFSKSIFAARDLAAGSRLCLVDLAFKKPGTGIPAKEYQRLVDRVLKQSLSRNDLIKEIDLE